MVLAVMLGIPLVLGVTLAIAGRNGRSGHEGRTVTKPAPPGWYADPQAPGEPVERWWDGAKWGEQRRSS